MCAFLYLSSQFQFSITSQYMLSRCSPLPARSRRPSLRPCREFYIRVSPPQIPSLPPPNDSEEVDQSLNLDLDLNILSSYIGSPCQAIHQRQEHAALDIPYQRPSIPVYRAVSTQRPEHPSHGSGKYCSNDQAVYIFDFLPRRSPRSRSCPSHGVRSSGKVCMPLLLQVLKTNLSEHHTSIRTNINMSVPPEQLQSVLHSINRALKQVEALLRSLGPPILEGSFPLITVPQPAPAAQPAPIEPAPAPTPTHPSPTKTIGTTSTNTRTTTATNGVVTISYPKDQLQRQHPTDPSSDCPATVTVNSTTTLYEGESTEATGVAA